MFPTFACRYTSNAGQVVLDPFMGTGSTGVGAIRKGRCFYGYEQKRTTFFSAAFYLAHALAEKEKTGKGNMDLYVNP